MKIANLVDGGLFKRALELKKDNVGNAGCSERGVGDQEGAETGEKAGSIEKKAGERQKDDEGRPLAGHCALLSLQKSLNGGGGRVANAVQGIASRRGKMRCRWDGTPHNNRAAKLLGGRAPLSGLCSIRRSALYTFGILVGQCSLSFDWTRNHRQS